MLIGIDLKARKNYEGTDQLKEGAPEHLTIKVVEGDDVDLKIGSDSTIGKVNLLELKQAVDLLVANMPAKKSGDAQARNGHRVV